MRDQGRNADSSAALEGRAGTHVGATGSGNGINTTSPAFSTSSTSSTSHPSGHVASSMPALSPAAVYDYANLLTGGSGASSLASISMPRISLPSLGFGIGMEGLVGVGMEDGKGAGAEERIRDGGDAVTRGRSTTISSSTSTTQQQQQLPPPQTCAFPPLPCASDSFPRPMSSKHELAIFEYEAARREWAVNGMPPEVAERYQAWLRQQAAQAAAKGQAPGAQGGAEAVPVEREAVAEGESDDAKDGRGEKGITQTGERRSKVSLQMPAPERRGSNSVTTTSTSASASASASVQWAETDMEIRTPATATKTPLSLQEEDVSTTLSGHQARIHAATALSPLSTIPESSDIAASGSKTTMTRARAASTSAPSVAPSSYYSDALVTTPLTTLASSHTTPVPAASATVAHGLAAAAATPTLDSIYDETKVRVDCQQQQQQRKRKIDDVLLEAEGLLGAGRSEASASALAQDAGAGAGVARRPRLRRR